jgi:hypothetical protein
MVNPADAGEKCLNCGANVPEQFCGRCGQVRGDVDQSLSSVLKDLLQELLHWEGRVPRTVRLLLQHPGELTVRFLAGQRVRYLAPLRLYLACSFAFFATYFLTLGILSFYAGLSARPNSELARVMSRAHLLSVPLIALVLHTLYRRPRRPLLHHVVFALHVGAAGLLIALLTLMLGAGYVLLGRSEGAVRLASGVIYPVGTLVYGGFLWRSMRRVYVEPWLWSVGKYLSLLISLWLTLSIVPMLLSKAGLT